MESYVFGLDFGTESARAVLVEAEGGGTVATDVHVYGDGVIDERLPGGAAALPPEWALQNADDWLASVEKLVPSVLKQAGVPGKAVAGLGIDFTSCTILPAREDGTPLFRLQGLQDRPHAWPKLWKHHASQPQADRVNARAQERGEKWLLRYGGKISSEWLLPKALQMLEEDPEVYGSADRIAEGADWVAWQLTGKLARNACGAGYKATWHKAEGYPSREFLVSLHPGFGDLYEKKLAGPVLPPGTRVGGLTASWARRLGLEEGTAVAAPLIDAHAAVLGGGVSGPNVLFMIMGTSTCHMLMAGEEVPVQGISGVVEDGILPGLFGYEAGQAAVGDIFAWFVEHSVPAAYHEEAAARSLSLHDLLAEKASRLKAGESGLLALDWWNGNRSTLVDADLSGVLLGMTLGTRAEEIYRALIEATAFGTQVIVEAFTREGIEVGSVVTGGGLTRNPLLMQIYSDVTGREMAVVGAEQVSALGAAMLGAVAAGTGRGGPASLSEAVTRMAPEPARVYRPEERSRETYQLLYREYRRLYERFGLEDRVLKTLRRLRPGTHG